jgi:MFS family permease
MVYPLMIASRCVFALIGSGTGPASQAYIAERTSRAERTAGVALVSAAMGLGETVGPGVGAALATVGLLAPIYLSAALAVLSAGTVWRFLPEEGPMVAQAPGRAPRMSPRDPRVLPFLLVSTSLQATRATTVITLAFFLQDTLQLSAPETVQYSGVGFVVLAASGLFAQLIVVQRFRPAARSMMRVGTALMMAAFILLAVGATFPVYVAALVSLGVGLGLVRPGSAAAASLSVGPDEQGSVAGILSGVAVIGNVFGPMLGTALYAFARTGPYVLNAVIMSAVFVLVVASKRVRSVRA